LRSLEVFQEYAVNGLAGSLTQVFDYGISFSSVTVSPGMGFTAHVIKKKTILPCNLKRLTA
jgi:hypothetical protein